MNEPKKATCPICNASFPPKQARSCYCSNRCYDKAKYARNPKRKPRYENQCVECGQQWLGRVPAKWCSNRCRSNARKPRCKDCAKKCSVGSLFCLTCEINRKKREGARITNRTCLHCHVVFKKTRSAPGKYCSRDCRMQPIYARHRVSGYVARSSEKRRRERYRMGERIKSAEVYAAQHHRCAMCKAVGQLTLDHVIPLSKGGQHQRWNVRGLCIQCNLRKANLLKFAYMPATLIKRPFNDRGYQRSHAV